MSAAVNITPQERTRRTNNIPYNLYRPIYDFKTKNTSFIDVQQQLESLGIKNNAFHLILLNPMLQGVDPHSDNLTNEQVMMIIQECKLNIFYYLREVVLVEEQGGGLVHFRMDRGTLAALYCFYNNINFYLMKPRQTGKTVGVLAMLSWAMKFAGPNGDMLFSCYRDTLAKKNLRGMKTILSHLPSYLSNMGTTAVDNQGKVVRKTNNITSYREPAQNNSAMVAPTASTEDSADTVGRGFTQIYQFFDEAEFTKYIGTIVKVSGMAYNTAARNAEKNGSGHCRIFTTTPGDLGNKKSCQSAMEIVKDAVIWTEEFYDWDINELKPMIVKKSSFRVIYIEYDYKQLGYGEDWFRDACANVGGDINKIKREILLMRFSGNSASPFTLDEIEDVTSNVRKPIAIKRVGKIYDILFYEKPKKNRMYFIGLDPSEGTGGDNYALTVIDPYTLQIVAEFRSPYMTVHGCVDLVTWLVDNYFNNCLLIIERNRNGGAVVEEFKRSKLRHRIYSSPKANDDTSRIKDELDENGFIKEEFVKNKYFGTNTTQSTRQVMMNILLDAMHFSRNLVSSRYVVDDVKNLVVKNNKIQAADGEHDDSVMSWLIALYIYYYGEKLERYGFRKGEMPQDIQEDDEFIKLQKLYKNPEIKRQFPTLYAYYQEEKRKHDIVKQMENEKNNSDYDTIKIGGIGNTDIEKARNSKNPITLRSESSDSGDVVEEVIPDIDSLLLGQISGTNESNEWKTNITQKFLSLNK